MELRQYGEVLRRRWRVVLIPALVVGAAMAAISLAGPTSYQSTTTLFYTPSGAASAAGLLPQEMQTYVSLVESPRAANAVISRLNVPLSTSRSSRPCPRPRRRPPCSSMSPPPTPPPFGRNSCRQRRVPG